MARSTGCGASWAGAADGPPLLPIAELLLPDAQPMSPQKAGGCSGADSVTCLGAPALAMPAGASVRYRLRAQQAT